MSDSARYKCIKLEFLAVAVVSAGKSTDFISTKRLLILLFLDFTCKHDWVSTRMSNDVFLCVDCTISANIDCVLFEWSWLRLNSMYNWKKENICSELQGANSFFSRQMTSVCSEYEFCWCGFWIELERFILAINSRFIFLHIQKEREWRVNWTKST